MRCPIHTITRFTDVEIILETGVDRFRADDAPHGYLSSSPFAEYVGWVARNRRILADAW